MDGNISCRFGTRNMIDFFNLKILPFLLCPLSTDLLSTDKEITLKIGNETMKDSGHRCRARMKMHD